MKNKLAVLIVSTLFVMSVGSNSAFATDERMGHNQHKGENSERVMKHKGERAKRAMKHKFKKMAKFLALTKD